MATDNSKHLHYSFEVFEVGCYRVTKPDVIATVNLYLAFHSSKSAILIDDVLLLRLDIVSVLLVLAP